VSSTLAVWIIREHITVRHVRGTLERLVEAGVLDYADVRVVAMKPGDTMEVPAAFRSANGLALPGGLISEADLPAEGLLFVANG
jgi:hypothetical protein